VTTTVAIGSDEAGFALKGRLVEELRSIGCEASDFGCYSADPVDYPDVALAVAQAIARGEHSRGILICGTGIGMAIAANKVPGVYAAQVHDPYSAERARASNNAQIMTVGARVVAPELAVALLRIWLQTEFQGGRSEHKVAKIAQAERRILEAGTEVTATKGR